MTHTREPNCPGCLTKLQGVDPHLANWFWGTVKKKYPSAHVCWGVRDQIDQDADFVAGRSMLKWPNSKHNFEIDGKKNSLAIDLFLIDENGMALFPLAFYQGVAQEMTSLMTWGGSFPHLKDLDHFQIDHPSGEELNPYPWAKTAIET